MVRRKIKSKIMIFLGIVLVLVSAFLIWVRLSTFHPAPVQSAPVTCAKETPILKPGQEVKVLTWNVQYMAGKNYVFFYDIKDGSGPDRRPSSEDIEMTLKAVARVIQNENPDIVLLQEVTEGDSRTDYEDQLAELLELLPKEYSCCSCAFYWKASFVPHPWIMGSVGMKLSVLSKYKIKEAVRHQLPLRQINPLAQPFYFKHAVLEIRLPVENAKDFLVLNTHLDAFAFGTDTRERQVKKIKSILEKLSQDGYSWIIGGDFNLLPPGKSYSLLEEKQKNYFREETEIKPLYEKYQAVPSLKEANSSECQKWFTHFPNDPTIEKPNKTIDYIFLANNIQLGEHYVRQHDTLKISDHLPLVAEFQLP